MPGSQFQTQVPTMQQAATHVDQVQQQLVAMLNAYWNRQQPIISASAWKGSGQVSFGVVADEWNRGMAKLNHALDAIGQQIRGSGQTYDTTDGSASSAIGTLQGATPMVGSVR